VLSEGHMEGHDEKLSSAKSRESCDTTTRQIIGATQGKPDFTVLVKGRLIEHVAH
jgi:hypothetical protein